MGRTIICQGEICPNLVIIERQGGLFFPAEDLVMLSSVYFPA